MYRSRYVLSAGMVVLAFGTLTLFAQVPQAPQPTAPPRRQTATPTAPPRQQTAAPSKGVTNDLPATPKKNAPAKKTRRRSHKRVYLGVCTVPVEDMSSRARRRLKLKNVEGVVVVEVMPDSPAEEAGLRHGDVITHVNGQAIEDEEELSEDLNRQGADKPIKLSILREGEKKQLTAELEEGSDQEFSSGYFGNEDGGFDEGGGGADHMTMMCIEHLERRISRLEKQLRELEKTHSAK